MEVRHRRAALDVDGPEGPTAIALTSGAGGLTKASIALCHQVTTLDRARLTRRIGSLSPADLDRLSAGLTAALE